ncbi:MAG TPA: adenylate/guanylate cyclase domain-containing protein [Leptospiraceae bacterium]|nr:adenylate/guanylate cyclase domain-containing protein [Leptospiraceae bacterium]
MMSFQGAASILNLTATGMLLLYVAVKFIRSRSYAAALPWLLIRLATAAVTATTGLMIHWPPILITIIFLLLILEGLAAAFTATRVTVTRPHGRRLAASIGIVCIIASIAMIAFPDSGYTAFPFIVTAAWSAAFVCLVQGGIRKEIHGSLFFAQGLSLAGALLHLYLLRCSQEAILLIAASALQCLSLLFIFQRVADADLVTSSLKSRVLFSGTIVSLMVALAGLGAADAFYQKLHAVDREHQLVEMSNELQENDFSHMPESIEYIVDSENSEIVFARNVRIQKIPFRETRSDIVKCETCKPETLCNLIQWSSPRHLRIFGPDLSFDIRTVNINSHTYEAGIDVLDYRKYESERSTRTLLFSYAALVIVTMALFFFLRHTVLTPLSILMENLQSLAKGEPTRPMPRDELGAVNKVMTRLMHRLAKNKDALTRANAQLQKEKNILEKFFSNDFVEQLLQEKISHSLGGARVPATIVFLDIRNSTAIAEKIDPQQFSDFISSIFTDIMDLVYGNHGSVNKLIGDGMLATFGCPIQTEDDKGNALRFALQVREYMNTFNDVRPDYLTEPVRIGIGIASGNVFAGNTGSVRRMEYTVLGDAVNLASRLESLTKLSGVDILIDGVTRDAAGNRIKVKRVRLNRVRGKIQEVRLYYLESMSDPEE